MGLLKDIAGHGGFGVLGLAATGHLGDVARSGLFGIGGALLAKRHHAPHPVFPQIANQPDAQQFKDPVSYLTAIQQWASGQLGTLSQGGQPGMMPQGGQPGMPPPPPNPQGV